MAQGALVSDKPETNESAQDNKNLDFIRDIKAFRN